MHGSRFDIRTGRVARPPAIRSEPTYEINTLLDLRALASDIEHEFREMSPRLISAKNMCVYYYFTTRTGQSA
jgi:hypothetical protein